MTVAHKLLAADVDVGGKSSILVPNINASKWDDETWLNLNYETMLNPSAEMLGNVATLTKGNEQLEIWPLNNEVIETRLTLLDKPAKNVFSFRIKGSEDLSFHYQPPLTQEEIKTGHKRIPRVEGSYAVYTNKRHNKYMCGKVAHLYRWIATDAKGNAAWCDMLVDGGYLHITVQPKFLDTAVYPVSMMGHGDTFGYTTAGASYVPQASGQFAYLSIHEGYTATTGDTVTTYHLNCCWAFGSSVTIGVTLYTGATVQTGGDAASRAFTASTITPTSEFSTFAWDTVSVSQALTGSTEYFLAVGDANVGGNEIEISYDSVGVAGVSAQSSNTLGTTWSEFRTETKHMSLYMTYTAGGGGGTIRRNPLTGPFSRPFAGPFG